MAHQPVRVPASVGPMSATRREQVRSPVPMPQCAQAHGCATDTADTTLTPPVELVKGEAQFALTCVLIFSNNSEQFATEYLCSKSCTVIPPPPAFWVACWMRTHSWAVFLAMSPASKFRCRPGLTTAWYVFHVVPWLEMMLSPVHSHVSSRIRL